MFGKFLVITLISICVFACARPNYQDIAPVVPGNGQDSLKTCGLKFLSSHLCVDLIWEVAPSDNGPGTFTLKFYSADFPDQNIDPPYSPVVVLWMPSMGHPSSPPTLQKTSTGVFQVTDIYFIMPGEWEIKIQLKNGTTVVDEVSKPITI